MMMVYYRKHFATHPDAAFAGDPDAELLHHWWARRDTYDTPYASWPAMPRVSSLLELLACELSWDVDAAKALECDETALLLAQTDLLRGLGCFYPRCPTIAATKSQRCSACLVARYCSRECQRRDWRCHKTVCPDLH